MESQQTAVQRVILGKAVNGGDVVLDIQELVTGRTLLCCISRWGKSWTARRIVEQLNGIAGVIIVDIEGEYYTLRKKFPGLWIIGQDTHLAAESASYVARSVLKERASAIIDLSNTKLDEKEAHEFVGDFVEEFVMRESSAKLPYLFILEEADELVPENGINRSECKAQVLKLIKKGGKRGIGTMILTQRPAWVSKFAISQCPNKIVGRTEWNKDLDTLRDFAQIPDSLVDPLARSPYALKNMEAGLFYVSGSFVEKETLVKVGPVETEHVGATPRVFSGASSIIVIMFRESPLHQTSKKGGPSPEENGGVSLSPTSAGANCSREGRVNGLVSPAALSRRRFRVGLALQRSSHTGVEGARPFLEPHGGRNGDGQSAHSTSGTHCSSG